ncbi:MAG: helix-turn-helix transcriptional regulator [Planctomycetota bacterium]
MRRSSDTQGAGPELPPFADRAIAALTHCVKLTDREHEVLTLCCSGLKNQTIAATLGISASAVRRHLRNLHRKTNTSDKAELILNLWHASRACMELDGV